MRGSAFLRVPGSPWGHLKPLLILSPVDALKNAPLASALARYTEFLKRKKMLATKERFALLEFVFRRRGHFSADEDLLPEMHRTGLKVSRATLYRTLKDFVEAGILIESPDFGHGHTHYELDLGGKPHVHLIPLDASGQVDKDGKIREVASPRLEALITRLARREKFNIKRYKIQVFGRFEKGPKA
jgi:Fur family ferric uptake transcriptional regulator